MDNNFEIPSFTALILTAPTNKNIPRDVLLKVDIFYPVSAFLRFAIFAPMINIAPPNIKSDNASA